MADGSFHYFLNQKKHVAVVSFLGNCDVPALAQLNACQEAIHGLVCEHIVLNFAGVPEISVELDPVLVRLQGNIRDSGKSLVICGLAPKLRKRLESSGIIRSFEVTASLVEALQKIVSVAVKK